MTDQTEQTNITSAVVSPVPTTGTIIVADKPSKPKPKRLSKSTRTHQRRLKQAARKPNAGG